MGSPGPSRFDYHRSRGIANAINPDIAVGIETALDRLEESPDIWVGVLAAAPPVFCAGADLKEIGRGNAKELATKRGGFAGIVRRQRTKPLIAAVDGAALAGGAEIALACDLIVASGRASFGCRRCAGGWLPRRAACSGWAVRSRSTSRCRPR